MQTINPQEKQEWQAPQLEVIETEETLSGSNPLFMEDTINNPSGIG